MEPGKMSLQIVRPEHTGILIVQTAWHALSDAHLAMHQTSVCLAKEVSYL